MSLKIFKLILIGFLLPIMGPRAIAATYYVANNGKATNNCLAPTAACLTIQQAANMTKPGDTVAVMTGTYSGSTIVPFSGTASAHITYMAAPGNKPVIKLSATKDWWGIGVAPGISYIDIMGFSIVGSAKDISQSQADAWAFAMQIYPGNAQSCIAIGGGSDLNKISHHITIYNNEVSFCPGAGIYSVHADYISFIGNKSHDNAWWNWNGGSGISLYELRNSDKIKGYKNFVMNNTVYANIEKVKHPTLGTTDGDGIIIDKNINVDSDQAVYDARTYIANNIVYFNGGNGIITFHSQHVDIVNNSLYANNSVLNRGEIEAAVSNDINVYNNIMYASPSKAVVLDGKCTSLNWDYNIVYGGNALAIWGPHDIWADPIYLLPGQGYFFLISWSGTPRISPAVGSGTPMLAPATDIFGASRAKRIDRGAIQAW